jgi:hypothetical protein
MYSTYTHTHTKNTHRGMLTPSFSLFISFLRPEGFLGETDLYYDCLDGILSLPFYVFTVIARLVNTDSKQLEKLTVNTWRSPR